MPIQKMSRLACLALVGALAPTWVHAQEPSGRAVSVIPDAEALRTAAQVRILMPDQPVFMGDRVKTGPRGEAQLLFSDETRLVVGPESSLLVERYLLKGDNTVSNFTVNALRGSFRFITGDSPKNAYAIKTPTATIGVRGTQFDLAIGANGETHFVLFDGSADVCSGGSCVRASDSCSMIEVSPGSRPQAVQDLVQRTQTLRDLFPYVDERANVLRSDFQVDARACGLFSQPVFEAGQPPAPITPILLPPAPPPSPPPPPPLAPVVVPPPPPPPPPKPPKEDHKPPKHHHVEHRPHHPKAEVKDDRHRHGPRRAGIEQPSQRHGLTEHRRAMDDRRAGRDRDQNRDQGTTRRAPERDDRPAFTRHAGGGIDWSAPGPVRHETNGARGRGNDDDRGARDRDGRERDGRDRDARGRDGRDREARDRDGRDRDGRNREFGDRDRRDGDRGRPDFARHAGGGIDWSSSYQPTPSEARGRDGRDGRNGRDDGRDGRRDNDRSGSMASDARGSDRDGFSGGRSHGSDSRDNRSGGEGSRGDAASGGGGHGGGGQSGGGSGGSSSAGAGSSGGGGSGGGGSGGGRDSEARGDGGRGESGRGDGGRGDGGRGDGGRGEGGRGEGGRGDGGRGEGGRGEGGRGDGGRGDGGRGDGGRGGGHGSNNGEGRGGRD